MGRDGEGRDRTERDGTAWRGTGQEGEERDGVERYGTGYRGTGRVERGGKVSGPKGPCELNGEGPEGPVVSS